MKNKFKVGDKVRYINNKLLSGFCPSNCKLGNVYTVKTSGSSDYDIITLAENVGQEKYYAHRFELVDEMTNEMTMEEQIKLANSYIGKNVISSTGSTFKVLDVGVYINIQSAKEASPSNEEYFIKHGFSVFVKGGGYNCPVVNVKLCPKNDTVKVKLNDQYDAVVHKYKIVVNCQTFPISILKALNSAHYYLTKNDD